MLHAQLSKIWVTDGNSRHLMSRTSDVYPLVTLLRSHHFYPEK